MEMPTPVNLGPLQALLAKSKQVMSKVEGEKPVKQSGNQIHESYDSEDSSNSYDSRNSYNDSSGFDDDRLPSYNEPQLLASDPTRVSDYTEEQVRASGMPEAIKEAMLKNRIAKPQSLGGGISAEEISRITGAPIRKPAQQQQQSQRLNENPAPRQVQNSDMITCSKAELKEMINEGISTFFKQVYDKTLTEETIRKTINLLIKEGKIGVKKKVV